MFFFAFYFARVLWFDVFIATTMHIIVDHSVSVCVLYCDCGCEYKCVTACLKCNVCVPMEWGEKAHAHGAIAATDEQKNALHAYAPFRDARP